MTASPRILFVVLTAILISLPSLLPEGLAVDSDFKSSMTAKFSRRTLFLFKGVVRDIEAQPVSGASITSIPSGPAQQRWSTMTDADGRFLFVSENTEEATFFVSKQGYQSFQTRPRRANAREIEVIVSKLFHVFGKVTDSESLEPVKSFRIIPGESYSSRRPIAWHRSGQQDGENGSYSFVANRKGGNISVAIEADGYLPVFSPRFRAPGWHNYDFALRKGLGLAGQVESPRGDHAGNAEVFLAVPFDQVELDKSGRLQSDDFDIVVSNSKGEFQFSARFEPQSIFAAHADGFVRMEIKDLVDSQVIRLKPWGQVEGCVGGRVPLEVRRIVKLRNTIASAKAVSRGKPEIKLAYSTDLRVDGRFSFDRVPPGVYEVRLVYDLDGNGELLDCSKVSVSVRPGEVADCVIGATSRTIAGQIALIGENPGEFDWRLAESRFRPQTPVLELGSDGGRDFPLLLRMDGSFQVFDVPPGDYELTVSLRSVPDEHGQSRILGTLSEEIVVSLTDDGTDEPFDAGTLRLQIKQKSKDAPVAPVF